MARTSFFATIALVFALSGTAFADQFYFVSPGSVIWNGVYVTPYTANDNTTHQNNLTIYCDDWNTDFSGNPTWNANVYALTAANVPDFKYGGVTSDYSLTLNSNTLSYASNPANAFDLYLEVAWLDDQLRTTNPNATQQTELAAAMWTLFVNDSNVAGLVGAINNSGFATDVFNDLAAAKLAVSQGYNAAGWDVIVPEDNNFPMQEFLVYDGVPEPSAVVLLATIGGLLVLMTLRRRRSRSRA